jgi:hypothetical protein
VAHYVVYGRELGRGEKLKTTSKHDLSLPIMRFNKVGPFFIIKGIGRGKKVLDRRRRRKSFAFNVSGM